MEKDLSTSSWFRRIGFFVFFLACALMVFVVFSYYYPMLSGKADLLGRIGLALLLLVAALLARCSERYRKFWLVLFAFFVALTAISLDFKLSLSKWILPAFGVETNTPAALAIEKFESSLLSIVVVLLLTLASGQKLSSLYLRRGNLWLGLAIGLGVFFLIVLIAMPLSEWFFGGKDLSWERILPWTPWVLVFALANGFNEELLFRGLFFGRMEPFLGKFATNLMMAIPFTLLHTGVEYTLNVLIFFCMLFPLSLAWGWLLQKTDSLWGSILFHAAMDIPIVLGIFSGL